MLAAGVNLQLDLVRRIIDEVAHQRLAEALHVVLDLSRHAARERVVGLRQLRIDGRQLVNLQVDVLALQVLLWGEARQVHCPGHFQGSGGAQAQALLGCMHSSSTESKVLQGVGDAQLGLLAVIH